MAKYFIFSSSSAAFLLIFLNSPYFVRPESYTAAESSDKLGVAYEFKIHVDPGREDCFFQSIHEHSTLYVAFQVMRGGDGKAGFAVRDPLGNFVLPHQWKESAEHEENSVPISGHYAFCIDNSFSRFASKLVSLYVASYKRDEWEKYIDEISSVDMTVSNFSTHIQAVDQNIGTILKYMDQSRRHMSRDWYLVQANKQYVQIWSVVQCIVIILASVTQVWFLRSFFKENKPGGGKPRA